MFHRISIIAAAPIAWIFNHTMIVVASLGTFIGFVLSDITGTVAGKIWVAAVSGAFASLCVLIPRWILARSQSRKVGSDIKRGEFADILKARAEEIVRKDAMLVEKDRLINAITTSKHTLQSEYQSLIFHINHLEKRLRARGEEPPSIHIKSLKQITEVEDEYRKGQVQDGESFPLTGD